MDENLTEKNTQNTLQNLSYHILMHPEAYQKAEAYRNDLITNISLSGSYLHRELQDKNISTLNTEDFIEHLVATKPPLIFAESGVYGDGRDWNQTELSILGDIGVAVRVQVYDNGKHYNPKIHQTPFPATLLYIPGALLRNDTGNVPADWNEVTQAGQIDPIAYQKLYERRLLPLLLYVNQQAQIENKQALITLPGLGCGQFAGPFIGKMGEYLKSALVVLLQKHAASLPNTQAVYYDPYNECQNNCIEFGSLSLFVRPLTQGNQDKSQLCEPSYYSENGNDFSNCLLYSIVAWDHVSWPGNDFYGGSRATDDGVKAAATSSMAALTGIQGVYSPINNTYDPPEKYRNWGDVVQENKLRITVRCNLSILGA